MRVTLLGTGDTTGTPTVGCDCQTCETAAERGIERTRCSVHIANERTGEALLIDASPDFRHQFLTQDVALPDAIVITHVHFDHLDGLGNAFRLCRELPVYASDVVDEITGESIAETVSRRYDYLNPVETYPVAPFDTFETCGLAVSLVPVSHPPLLSYGVTVEDPETGGRLAMTGDTNYAVPERSRAALADADLLLADAIVHADYCEGHPAGGDHYEPDGVAWTFGAKHMTREGAQAFAETCSPDTLRLVHASHFYPADEAFADPLAVDGEQFVL